MTVDARVGTGKVEVEAKGNGENQGALANCCCRCINALLCFQPPVVWRMSHGGCSAAASAAPPPLPPYRNRQQPLLRCVKKLVSCRIGQNVGSDVMTNHVQCFCAK